MTTLLPQSIQTVEAAKALLVELNKNGESFHPEDDAHDIIWSASNPPTAEECDLLNKLMEDIYSLDGFDPCEFLLSLDPEYTTE